MGVYQRPNLGGGFFPGLRRDLAELGRSPRELWIIYAVKFLESIAYFSVYNLLVVYLSDELGYSDVKAGSIMGTWLLANSVLVFVSGFAADAMGIRRALLIAIASCLLGRAMITLSATRPVALTGLFVMTWGVASMLPTMTAAVRKYTRPETVSFGFSFFYVMMNLGAFVAGPTVSYFRAAFRRPAVVNLPGGVAMRMSSSQLVFLVGLVVTLIAAALVFFGMRDAPRPAPAAAGAEDPSGAVYRRADAPTAPAEKRPSIVSDPTFWRFMLFVSLLVLVRLIFQHAHQTWPKYTLREFGPTFPFASYWSLNPLMIIFLTPVVTALTRTRSAFAMIAAGSFLSAASVLFMAASTTVTASVLFIVTLSVGEALWSPRLYEYTTVIAPKGREASYMGLSQVPMFLAKPFVGFISGSLLATYCPRTGPRHSQTMWLVIAATTFLGPVLIVLLRNVIDPKRKERAAEPEPAAT